MATATITYDGRNSIMKQLLQIIVSLGYKVEIINSDSKTAKGTLATALEDIKAGRVHEAKSVDDMMKQILG